MLRTTGLALAAIAFMAGPALADPIEGSWKTASGSTAAISGGGSFTIILKSGKFAGKTIGSSCSRGRGSSPTRAAPR